MVHDKLSLPKSLHGLGADQDHICCFRAAAQTSPSSYIGDNVDRDECTAVLASLLQAVLSST